VVLAMAFGFRGVTLFAIGFYALAVLALRLGVRPVS
jgi:hypothetical protein